MKPTRLADYEPDKGVLSGAGMVAKGVLSASGRYVPLPGLEALRSGAGALVDTCLGGRSFYDTAGAPVTFLGDARRLYRLVGRAPVDVSDAALYAADPDGQWSFDQFGNNILAAARGAALQRYVLGTSSVFAPIAGAPTAETVFVVRQHAFACAGSTVNWSAFNNIADWTPATATQAGNTTVAQALGPAVTGIGGEQGALFLENGIIRIGYQGGDIPWLLDDVEGGRGACSPGSVRRWGRGAFVASPDGFYFFDGLQALPLGADKVDKTFATALNYGYRGRVSSAVDTASKSWMIAYPSGSSPTCDKLLIYNWQDKRWTHDDLDVQVLLELAREAVTADDEAGIISLVGTADADQIAVSVDSAIWREGRRSWAAVDATRSVKTFSGLPRAAEVETGETMPLAGGIAHVKAVMPQTDAEPGYVSSDLYAKMYRRGETARVVDQADMDDLGVCALRGEGRYVKARIKIAAGAPWSEISAVAMQAEAAGER